MRPGLLATPYGPLQSPIAGAHNGTIYNNIPLHGAI